VPTPTTIAYSYQSYNSLDYYTCAMDDILPNTGELELHIVLQNIAEFMDIPIPIMM